MSLKKLNELHRNLGICEVLLEYTRSEILEKYRDRVSSINNLHRIMNDPLMKAYIEELRELKLEKVMERRLSAENAIWEGLTDVAKEMVRLSLSAQSEMVRAKAGKDVMAIGFKDSDKGGRVETPHLSVYDGKAAERKAEDG